MIERVLFAVVFGGLCWLGYWAYTRWQMRRVQTDPILKTFKRDVPTIVYFTTPQCVPCKTVQKPALTRLQAELGEGLHVIEIDATLQPQIADHWGVLTAPTTFVFDAKGKPSAVNHGTADLPLLKKQLSLPTSA